MIKSLFIGVLSVAGLVSTAAGAGESRSAPQLAFLVAAAPIIRGPSGRAAAPEVGRLSRAYGVDRWGDVAEVSFAFVSEADGAPVRRDWHWDILTGNVRGRWMQGERLVERQGNVDAAPNDTGSLAVAELFLHDGFWLVLPAILPTLPPGDAVALADASLGDSGATDRLRIRIPGGGRCDFSVGQDNLIRQTALSSEWHSSEPIILTWERPAKAGPYLFSLAYRDRAGQFNFHYEDLKIRTVDGAWQTAVPLDAARGASREAYAVPEGPSSPAFQ